MMGGVGLFNISGGGYPEIHVYDSFQGASRDTLSNINPLFHAWAIANLQVMSPKNSPRTYNPVGSFTHVIQNCLELNHAGKEVFACRPP